MEKQRLDVKVLLLGHELAGKNILLQRATDYLLKNQDYSIIGADFNIKKYEFPNVIVKLRILDTPCQEKFK